MIFRWKGFSKRMKFAQDLLFCCNTILCQMAATAFLFPMFRTVLMSEWGTFWRVWKKQTSSLWKYLSNAASFVLIGYVRAEFWILSEFLLCLNLNFWIVKQTNTSWTCPVVITCYHCYLDIFQTTDKYLHARDRQIITMPCTEQKLDFL